jgi:hypothetical protein
MRSTTTRLLLVAPLALAGSLLPAPAGGQEEPPQQISRSQAAQRPDPCPTRFTARAHGRYVRAVNRRTKVSARARRNMARMRRCAVSDRSATRMRRVEHREHRRRVRRAREERLTPFGQWAIPAYVVACESRGQNLPPNSAGASGFYQMLQSTFESVGGRGPAYRASKAEQDRAASRLWAGGAGAGQWDCS